MPYTIYKSTTEKPAGWPEGIGYEDPVKVKVESKVTKSSAETAMVAHQVAEPDRQFILVEE